MRPFIRLLAFACIVLNAVAAPGDRVALVIGCGSFDSLASASQLARPTVEADAFADALEGLTPKFTVFRLKNGTRAQTIAKLVEFSAAAKDAECALIHIGTHGIEHFGENFFFARDTDPSQFDKETDDPSLSRALFEGQTITLTQLKGAVTGAKAALSFIILDACREHPQAKQGTVRSMGVTRGIGNPGTTPKGTVILYAADAGNLANDGLFTPTLIRHIRTPDLPISNLISRTGDAVEEASKEWAKEDAAKGIPAPRRRVFQSPNMYGKFNEAALSFSFVPGKTPGVTLTPKPAAIEIDPVAAATKETPFVNGFGMKFVPVPGTGVLMSVWETRVQDYELFVKATRRDWKKPDFTQAPTHPAVNVSWEDAKAFAKWLSARDGREYRLPTDAVWSLAVGRGKYPWGDSEKPPVGAGNYDSNLKVDSFEKTAPVGSFKPNALGIYDLGGNAGEWCEDEYKASMNDADLLKETMGALKEEKSSTGTPLRVVRDNSWGHCGSQFLRSSFRIGVLPTFCSDEVGFRVVVDR